MTKIINQSKQFKKDLKRISKQGKNLLELYEIVNKLVNNEFLDKKFKDHLLKGNYFKKRECHIAPDWLLIYQINKNELVLFRTGSHAELFR